MVLGDEFSVSETRLSSFTSINEFELVMIWSLCFRHHVMGFGCKLVVFRLQSSSMILDLYWSEFSLVLFWWTLPESSLVFVSFSCFLGLTFISQFFFTDLYFLISHLDFWGNCCFMGGFIYFIFLQIVSYTLLPYCVFI